MWCVAELDEEYIARMEDVLAVYEKPLSVREPVVCIDEKPVVLHQEVRPPVALQPGRVARRDGEYQRCGTANVFCGVQPKAGRISPKYQPPLSPEFADYLLDCCALPRGRYHPSGDGQSEFAHPQSGRRTLWRRGRRLAVESVHRALHSEARQLVQPGEIAISLLSRQCFGQRRIGDRVSLRKQTQAWNRRMNRTESKSSGALLASRLARSLATQSRGHGTS